LKETSPFFSIIIPTYNSVKLLSKALDSVSRQNFDDYEVIIIDGLSTDKTIEIAEEYAQNDSKIKIFTEKDEGIYDAMNKGIVKARGAYLYFLGSDDTFYDKDVLVKVHDQIQKVKADVLYGSVCSNRLGSKYDGEFTYEKLSKKNIGHQAIFFKKSIFNKTGNFEIKYKALADWHHNIRWFFSDRVRNTYIDIIIANYTEGGFSDQYVDTVFNRDKFKIFFKHGLFKLKTHDFIRLTKDPAKAYKKEKKYFNYIFYRTIFHFLKSIKKINSS
jgi:glycosyltransferase involved in cell wall biosynthesis